MASLTNLEKEYSKLESKSAKLDKIHKAAIKELTPIMQKFISGQMLTDKEFDSIKSCPTILQNLGYSYLSDIEKGKSPLVVVSSHLEKLRSRSDGQDDGDKVFSKLLDNSLQSLPVSKATKPMLTPLPLFSLVTPRLRYLAEQEDPSIKRTHKVNGKAEMKRGINGAQAFMKKQSDSLSDEKCQAITEVLVEKYPTIIPLLASEKKDFLDNMIRCGNVVSTSGKTVKEDCIAMIKMVEKTKEFFASKKADLENMTPDAFCAKYKKELDGVQRDFLEAVKTQASIPTKGQVATLDPILKKCAETLQTSQSRKMSQEVEVPMQQKENTHPLEQTPQAVTMRPKSPVQQRIERPQPMFGISDTQLEALRSAGFTLKQATEIMIENSPIQRQKHVQKRQFGQQPAKKMKILGPP